MPRCWLCLLWLILPVMAYATAPSQEFWDYMADFSDENGEVIDPLELDEAISTKEDAFKTQQGEKETVEKSVPDEPQGHVKNAELKTTTGSSATTASRKGAIL